MHWCGGDGCKNIKEDVYSDTNFMKKCNTSMMS